MGCATQPDSARPLAAGTLLLWLILVSGFIVRLARVTADSLMLDEIWSVTYVADRSLAEVVADSFRADFHPFAYHAVLDLWTAAFGYGALAARLPSVLLGTLGLWAAWRLALRVSGCRTTALLTVALLAIHPLHARFSLEARMYILLITSWVFCLHYLLQVVQQNLRLRPVLMFLGWFVVFNYSHASSGFIALPFVVLVLVCGDFRQPGALSRRVLIRKAGVVLVAVVLYVPWLVRLARLGPVQLLKLLYELLYDRELPGFSQTHSALVAALLLLCAAGLGAAVVYCAWRRAGSWWLIGASLAVPVLTVAAISLIKPFHQPRNLCFLVTPFALLLAGLLVEGWRRLPQQLTRLPRWLPRAGVLVTGLLLVVPQLAVTSINLTQGYELENWRGAVERLAVKVRPGECIVLYAGFVELCYDYYMTAAWTRPNPHAAAGIACYPVPREAAEFAPAVRALSQRLVSPPRPRRVWVVYSHVADRDALDTVLQSRGLQPEAAWRTPGIELVCYPWVKAEN